MGDAGGGGAEGVEERGWEGAEEGVLWWGLGGLGGGGVGDVSGLICGCGFGFWRWRLTGMERSRYPTSCSSNLSLLDLYTRCNHISLLP